MVERLKGKVALVVGAGSIGPGWGKATAVAFAREGARVFCANINPAAAEETAGHQERGRGGGSSIPTSGQTRLVAGHNGMAGAALLRRHKSPFGHCGN